jgi:class 3 adenylate cyclase
MDVPETRYAKSGNVHIAYRIRTGRAQLARFRGREIDTAGDGFLATFDGPARGVRCAQAIARSVRDLGIAVRAGVHAGELELAGGDVRGIAVHVDARVCGIAGPDEVLVTSTVRDLVAGSGLVFDHVVNTNSGAPERGRLFAANDSPSVGTPRPARLRPRHDG